MRRQLLQLIDEAVDVPLARAVLGKGIRRRYLALKVHRSYDDWAVEVYAECLAMEICVGFREHARHQLDLLEQAAPTFRAAE